MSDVAAVDPAPDASEPAPAPETSPEAEGQDLTSENAPEIDPSEVPPEPTAPESVEIEIDRRKYFVPAALSDGYMQHADYTTKTQELARGRESLVQREEALTQRDQAQRENVQDWGEFAHTEKLLEGFRQVDWQRLYQEDPEQHQQLAVQFNVLRDQREQIGRRIQQREHETRANAQREITNRQGYLKATLAREIPSYTPELQGRMDETAIRHGFTQAEIDTVVDPRMMRILHLAHLGEQVVQRKRAAIAQPAPAPVTPVPKVGGGRTPPTGPTDKQGIEAWMRSREQQLRRGSG